MIKNDEIVITPDRGIFNLGINKIWNHKGLIYMLVKRDFITFYKQTILGPLWYLIQPVFSTIMYMIIFGNIAHIGTNSIPQPLFYFSGTMLWIFFSDNMQKASRIFIDNKALFGKVYFPRIIVHVSNTVGNAIKLGIQFVLFLVIYIYYIFTGAVDFSGLQVVLGLISVIWIDVIAVGLGMIVSSITTKYRDLAIALEFLTSLYMYATPIVYPMSEATGKLKTILCLNPLSVPVEMFRYAFFDIIAIPIWSVIYSIVMSVVILLTGLIVFNRNEQTFIDVI